MFVSSYEMINKAYKNGYAVPAFNAENMEMVHAIIKACEEENSPVIIQTTPPTVKYFTPEVAYAIVKTVADKTKIPVALHLDHCAKFEEVMIAIKAGYSSVMFDGSKLPFEENVEITKKVVEVAHAMGITVEAELGAVGGKEDNVESKEIKYTDVLEAKEFVKQTNVDMLAIAIGTAHGFYKGEPKLDFKRIDDIKKTIDLPLVLHGGSGIPEESVKKSISLGMSKANFATELRAAATMGVRNALKDESIIDPKKFMAVAKEEVVKMCKSKIAMCGSKNKA